MAPSEPGRPSARSRLRERGYGVLDRWPRAYVAYRRWRAPDQVLVDATTELVVEGYPASANSFAREVLREANPGLAVASHAHVSSQVRLAVHFGVPVIVLVRDPVDAIASIVSRRPDRHVDAELRRYEQFHRRVHAVLDRVAVVTFDQVTHDPGALADAVPELELAHPDEAEVGRARERLSRWDERVFGADAAAFGALPSSHRRERREAVVAALAEPVRGPAVARCRQLHAQFSARAAI